MEKYLWNPDRLLSKEQNFGAEDKNTTVQRRVPLALLRKKNTLFQQTKIQI